MHRMPPIESNDKSCGMDPSLQREIHMARKIQMKLLNSEKPKLETGEVSGRSIPARLIGGDYFDFYPLSNGRIRIIIGDVMGKGIPAAMLMILTRGAFRSAAEATNGPGETLTAMNRAIYSDLRKLTSFVTVFCADWDAKSGIFTYSNAGHLHPLVVGPNRNIRELSESRGVMIGGLPDQVYLEKQIVLQQEECVFLYTDGIIEANNERGEMFGRERLSQLLIEQAHEGAEVIEEAVVQGVSAFSASIPQKDDITMVILKVGQTNSEIISYNAPIPVR